MLKILMALYSNTSSCVKLNNVCSDIFLLNRGLRQGDSLSPVLFIFYINNLAGRLSKNDSSKTINILQYADDLAIFAESEELLQTKLDMLQIYCKEKKLCVNISKSKIVVFHANKSQTSLMYNNCVLEEVDCFNYLGLTWHRKRNMHYAQQIIVKQATRAKAVLDAHLRKHKNMPVDMIFLLFDTLVRPILLFNCEIWGIKISKELELFHLKFKKSILGVKATTNTCLVYIETGRYPLYITIYKLIIKYWLKLIVSPKHRYIYVVSKK